MATQVLSHEGRWRRLSNWAVNNKGLIHNDEGAREMGFRSALVPATTVASAVMPAIVAHLGQRWFDGGWYSLKFIAPVYVEEEVREVAESNSAADQINFRLETRDGRLTCGGLAGLGATPPWHVEEDGMREADVAFPHMTLGEQFGPQELQVTEGEILRDCDGAGDMTPWFRGSSPWGGAIAPPSAFIVKVGRITSSIDLGEGVNPEGLIADLQIVVRQPVFVGKPYVFSGSLVDKGVSGRTHFWTTEFKVADSEGVECARGRLKTKYFRK